MPTTMARDPGEDRLEGVETDHRVAIVGLEHQEQNAGEDADQVAQRRGDVLFE